MKAVLNFLKNRWFIGAVGLLALGLLVWFVGPYFAFGRFRPLDSMLERTLTILVIAFLWIVLMLVRELKARKASAGLAKEIVGQAGDKGAAGGQEALQLRHRFEEAVAAIGKTRGKEGSLYNLPWYIIIGPPGSGKTTALVNSGLKFPLSQRFGKDALRGVGGTRNCDWWFTDEAILLDTAGRYTTQDSDRGSDSAEWGSFLGLLKKYRKRRPINGVLVAMSLQDLMLQTREERERHVLAIRERLEELYRDFRITLPVYFLVTKTDLVSGFIEFFDDLGQEQRAQVWGTTFPLDKKRQAAPTELFAAEYELLMQNLRTRMWQRLEQERDPARRAQIFAFPQQMTSLGESIASFVSDTFGAGTFEKRVLLRGVYLTSGTQEGTPIDRLMSSMARSLGVDMRAVAPAAGRGRSYFIRRMLQDVVFAESGLAGVNRGIAVRKAVAQNVAYVAALAAAALLVAGLWMSHRANRAYLDEVAQTLSLYEQQAGAEGPAGSVAAALPGLAALRHVYTQADRYRDDRPWRMQLGLFQGNSVGSAARDAYLRRLNQELVPLLARQLERRLGESAGQPEMLYEYLKTYLMLGQPEHLDRGQLAFFVEREVGELFADQPEVQQQLFEHFKVLLSERGALTPIPLDQGLVESSRVALRQASLAYLMYSDLRGRYGTESDRALRLDVASGIGAEKVLRRRSGKSLADPVAALYTYDVFHEVAGAGSAKLLEEFLTDSWVLGGSADLRATLAASAEVVPQMMRLYEDDYIKVWSGILEDVEVVAISGREQAVDVMTILSSATSPLKGLLQTVERNTNLTRKPDNPIDAAQQNLEDQASKAAQDRLDKMFQAGGGQARAKPYGTRVTEHFKQINRLVEGADGSTPLDGSLRVLQAAADQLAAAGSSTGPQDPRATEEATRRVKQAATQLPSPLKEWIGSVGERGQDIAMQGARTELAARYNEIVGPECRAITRNRYPFSPGGSEDVPIADFGRLLGHGGVLDSFYSQHLAPLVDTSGQTWRWRSGDSGSIGLPASLLRQFQSAAAIRRTFFEAGGQMPKIRFSVVPEFLDDGSTRFVMDVDGQVLDYRHGPVRTVTMIWPSADFGRMSVMFEAGGITSVAVQADGPWALFRGLDQVNLEGSGTQYTTTFRSGASSARVRIAAGSVHNPFGKRLLQDFRCVEAL